MVVPPLWWDVPLGFVRGFVNVSTLNSLQHLYHIVFVVFSTVTSTRNPYRFPPPWFTNTNTVGGCLVIWIISLRKINWGFETREQVNTTVWSSIPRRKCGKNSKNYQRLHHVYIYKINTWTTWNMYIQYLLSNWRHLGTSVLHQWWCHDNDDITTMMKTMMMNATTMMMMTWLRWWLWLWWWWWRRRLWWWPWHYDNKYTW